MEDSVTADGCAVEVYRRLPAAGEPELVHAALPAAASVLDLGCGTGRVAGPLVRLGHHVVGVDDSPAMLAHLTGVEPVCSRIEELALPRRFDGVLLASHLINTEDAARRDRMLTTARRHLAESGRVLVQWHPPEWFDRVTDDPGGYLGEVLVRLDRVRRDGELLHATVHYTVDDRSWSQPFTARRLTEPELHRVLAAAGLTFDGWCAGGREWFAARHR